MSSTPEGKIKDKVKRALAPYFGSSELYGWWPVPAGYGENSLDFVGCLNGQFFAVETKARGAKPTALQKQIIRRIELAQGKVFVIDSDEGVEKLKLWLGCPEP